MGELSRGISHPEVQHAYLQEQWRQSWPPVFPQHERQQHHMPSLPEHEREQQSQDNRSNRLQMLNAAESRVPKWRSISEEEGPRRGTFNGDEKEPGDVYGGSHEGKMNQGTIAIGVRSKRQPDVREFGDTRIANALYAIPSTWRTIRNSVIQSTQQCSHVPI